MSAWLRRQGDVFRAKAFRQHAWKEAPPEQGGGGGSLKRVLGPLDLTLIGVGSVVGAGIFVITGVAAKELAGPAILVSYLLAGLSSSLAALAYVELGCAAPAAGGAFNYIALTFGEYAGWLAACYLFFEYLVSGAAVAKGFTQYFASLFRIPLSALRYGGGGSVFQLDWLSALFSTAVCAATLRGAKGSARLNTLFTAAQLLLMAFIIIVGLTRIQPVNYTPFAPYGARGVLSGASVIFFSYIGFDVVSNMAEEAGTPGRDLPIGVLACIAVATLLYGTMCVVITGMVRYSDIDASAPFAAVFVQSGLSWVSTVVSLGALLGIATSEMGMVLGQSRIFVTLGRSGLLPRWLAAIHPATGSPVNATAVTAVGIAALTLTLDMALLAEMVSMGTLFVFFMVLCAVVWRRYTGAGTTQQQQQLWEEDGPSGAAQRRPVAVRLVAVGFASAVAGLSYNLEAHAAVTSVALVAWVAATASFHALSVVHRPASFAMPFVPWLPCLGVLSVLFLIASLGPDAYLRWAIVLLAASLTYLLYGMHHTAAVGTDTLVMTQQADEAGEQGGGGGGGEVALAAQQEGRKAQTDGDGGVAPLLLGAGAASSRGHMSDSSMWQQQQQQKQQSFVRDDSSAPHAGASVTFLVNPFEVAPVGGAAGSGCNNSAFTLGDDDDDGCDGTFRDGDSSQQHLQQHAAETSHRAVSSPVAGTVPPDAAAPLQGVDRGQLDTAAAPASGWGRN